MEEEQNEEDDDKPKTDSDRPSLKVKVNFCQLFF